MALMPFNSPFGVARVRPYLVASSVTLYEGQLLKVASNGNVVAWADGDTTSALIIGVAAATVSCTSTTVPVWIPVYDDPAQKFRVPTTAAITAANINETAATSGNANTVGSLGLISACKLDQSSLATTTKALKIVGVPAGGLNSATPTGLVSAWNMIPGMSFSSTNPGTMTTSTSFYEAIVMITPGQHANNVLGSA